VPVEEWFDFVVESAGDGHTDAFMLVDVFSSKITFACMHATILKRTRHKIIAETN